MAAEAEGGFAIYPMDQFMVRPLFGGTEIHWYTPTNVTLWLAISILAALALFLLGTRGRATVPSRLQSMAELTYTFVHRMVEDILGREGLRYFPWVFTIFVLVAFSNFLGLIPYSFTTTSQISATAVLAVLVFVSVTMLGFALHGVKFLELFWVRSAPLPLRPVLAVIELISYFVRPVSHSIRLAGNMMAGHAVLMVFAGFAGALGLGAIVTIIAISAVYALETLVAFIQAYVFTILTVIYLRDALHPSH